MGRLFCALAYDLTLCTRQVQGEGLLSAPRLALLTAEFQSNLTYIAPNFKSETLYGRIQFV